jgi:DNA gyrase subunit B
LYFKIKPIKLEPSVISGVGSGAELFIVEGDSAASAVSGIRNTQFQAVLPMQGKPLNAIKATGKKVANSVLYTLLSQTLGIGLADASVQSAALPFGELHTLRYDRILLLFDPDADGIHCGALMLMFFYRWMRPLLESGRIEIVRAPMFELRWQVAGEPCASPLQAYSEGQQRSLQQQLVAQHAHDIKAYRYRGLGNIDPALLSSTCVDPRSRKTTVAGLADARLALEVFGGSPLTPAVAASASTSGGLR